MIELDKIIGQVAVELNLKKENAYNTVQLLDNGATIPFIARYRKEATGGMDDDKLRALEKRIAYLRQLTTRKREVLNIVEEQGKLSRELTTAIEAATSLQEVEDLYLPFRPKRRTRASTAREKGLEPLARLILTQKTYKGSPTEVASRFIDKVQGVDGAEEALNGARDIVAELIAEDAEVRRRIRQLIIRQGVLKSRLAKGAKDETNKYEQYHEYSEPLFKIPPHRLLALNRGEKEGILSTTLEITPGAVEKLVEELYLTDIRSIFSTELRRAIGDSLKRLILPSLENEVRAVRTEEAEAHAIKVFATNLKQLLLQPPIRGQIVLGLDPGFRSGCKVAVIDETGKPLITLNIYPHEPKRDWIGAKKTLKALINKYKVGIIAVGNGTASRETENLAAEVIAECAEQKPAYIIVNEAGASVYSVSEAAGEEFPDMDATERGTISIARRLQDPLAELVKVDPKSIGVGLYQHDVNQKTLAETLDNVVVSCVNFVGVDLNTASASLLKYVSGINKKVAGSIVTYREKNGPFKTRLELKKIAGLGEKAFEQAAGFLRIPNGANPFDNTFIHPESYEAARKLLASANLIGNNYKRLAEYSIQRQIKEFKAKAVADNKLEELGKELGLGVLTVVDILDSLEKPGRDPREELPKPILRQDILKLEDLTTGMLLKGTVRNVVDFGVFVDIGVKQDGLVHITEMSTKFVKHPLEVVNVGDIIEVKVINIDQKRGRVSLSMKVK